MNINNTSKQKINDCNILIKHLLEKHNLNDWDIKINGRRLSVARTYYDTKIISYSKFFLAITNKERLEGVTLHEIAHILTGRGNGHNDKFVKMCKKISLNDAYAKHMSDIILYKYFTRCPVCDTYGCCNSLKNIYCNKCREKGIETKLEITNNDTKVVPL